MHVPAQLRVVDFAGAESPVFGAAWRSGRAQRSRGTTLEVTGPSGLTWRVRRLLFPVSMLPHPPREMLRLSDPSLQTAAPLTAGVLLVPFTLPFLPLVLFLRSLRLLPWTIEARTYPWGKRFPPIVHAYEVRGTDEAERALRDLAAALARGEGAPVVPGAERVL